MENILIKIAEWLLSNLGFAGIVILGLVIDRFYYSKRVNKLIDELHDKLESCQNARIDVIKQVTTAIEQSTAVGIALTASRETAARMSEETNRGILTLVAQGQREYDYVKEKLDQIPKQISEKVDQNTQKLVVLSDQINRRRTT